MEDPSNFRPIVVVPVLAKILERIGGILPGTVLIVEPSQGGLQIWQVH